MINFFSKFKIIFYCSNFFLTLLYLFPGSLLGLIIYNDKKIQPQITSDFIISSNHFIAFAFISIIGFFTFRKKKRSYTFNILPHFFINNFRDISHNNT